MEEFQVTSRQAARPIEEVLREQTDRLMAVPGVVGTALGLWGGKPCIKVYVEADASEVAPKIPGTLGGYPVRVEKTGEIRARPVAAPTEGA
jgi:hypothetical protein